MFDEQHITNGVIHLSPKVDTASASYLYVRKKEGRILADKEVLSLPTPVKSNINYREWALRKKSSDRFISYINAKNNGLSILDIGCGNGWFTHLLSQSSSNHQIVGLDINITELEQASRVFNRDNIRFVYGDLFQINSLFEGEFDMITMNACVQYFSDFKGFILKIRSFLKEKGEIHIIDSPFYHNSEIEAAKERTTRYYKSIGAPEMSSHYFHHSLEELNEFDVLYNPSKGLANKLFRRTDSPFKWLRYVKNQ